MSLYVSRYCVNVFSHRSGASRTCKKTSKASGQERWSVMSRECFISDDLPQLVDLVLFPAILQWDHVDSVYSMLASSCQTNANVRVFQASEQHLCHPLMCHEGLLFTFKVSRSWTSYIFLSCFILLHSFTLQICLKTFSFLCLKTKALYDIPAIY